MRHPRPAHSNVADGSLARELPLAVATTVRQHITEVGRSSAIFFTAAWGHKELPPTITYAVKPTF